MFPAEMLSDTAGVQQKPAQCMSDAASNESFLQGRNFLPFSGGRGGRQRNKGKPERAQSLYLGLQLSDLTMAPFPFP